MKVLLLVHEGLYGGGSRQSFYLLESLVQAGLSAVLVSNAKESWLGRQLEKQPLPVKTYYTSVIQRSINPLKELLAFLYLIGVFLKEKPDVLLTCGVKLIGLGCFAGWLCRIPLRVAIIRGQGAPEGSVMLKIIYAMERFVALLGTRFITVCDYNRQEMITQGIAKSENLVTIHNGTDLVAYGSGCQGWLRRQYNLSEDAFIIGMVGRLSRQKRFDQFIQLLVKLCECHSTVYGFIIGDGEDRDPLQQQINAAGMADRIFITGFVEQMPDLYSDLNLSVLLTRYEGCANALLESAVAGVPIIADAVCGNSEVVIHGENGYIFQPGDIQQAIAYAQTLITDPKACCRMGQRGREIAQERFDRVKQTARLVQVLQQWPASSNSPFNSIEHSSAIQV